MKDSSKLRGFVRIPSSVPYLVLISFAGALFFELLFSLWAMLMFYKEGVSVAICECFLILPKYCLGLSHIPITGSVIWLAAILRAFFFAALVSLFYEVYKSLVERRRLTIIEKKIYESFKWTFNRSLGLGQYYLPWYRTFAYLRVHLGLTDDEIIRACKHSNRLRVNDLALTRSLSSYQYDKYVVECYLRNEKYGCKVDNGSNVTIVVPTTELCLSTFGFYLSYLGGFNFVAKQIQDENSFYNVTKETRDDSMYRVFFQGICDVVGQKTQSKEHLVIVLCALNYIKDSVIYMLDGDKNNDNKTIKSDSIRTKLIAALNEGLKETKVKLDLPTDKLSEEYYLKNPKSDEKDNGTNLLYELFDNEKLTETEKDYNGFVLRIPANLNVWDKKRIKTIEALADSINLFIESNRRSKDESFSVRETGFEFFVDQKKKFDA